MCTGSSGTTFTCIYLLCPRQNDSIFIAYKTTCRSPLTSHPNNHEDCSETRSVLSISYRTNMPSDQSSVPAHELSSSRQSITAQAPYNSKACATLCDSTTLK